MSADLIPISDNVLFAAGQTLDQRIASNEHVRAAEAVVIRLASGSPVVTHQLEADLMAEDMVKIARAEKLVAAEVDAALSLPRRMTKMVNDCARSRLDTLKHARSLLSAAHASWLRRQADDRAKAEREERARREAEAKQARTETGDEDMPAVVSRPATPAPEPRTRTESGAVIYKTSTLCAELVDAAAAAEFDAAWVTLNAAAAKAWYREAVKAEGTKGLADMGAPDAKGGLVIHGVRFWVQEGSGVRT